MKTDTHKYVLLAGSGRSGTTWLGSILDSYEKSEYFYEPFLFDDLGYNYEEILRIKYPLTFWWSGKPLWVRHLERFSLLKVKKYGLFDDCVKRTLKINHRIQFEKNMPDVCLIKEVRLLKVINRLYSLDSNVLDNFTLIHIIRNPYACITSEVRQQQGKEDEMSWRSRQRLRAILDDSRFEQYHSIASKYLESDWLQHLSALWWISNMALREVVPINRVDVIYERLCANTFSEVERVFDFLGWDMSIQTQQHITETTNISESEHGTYSIRKNSEESIHRWRKEITPENYERITQVLESCPLLQNWSSEELSLEMSSK